VHAEAQRGNHSVVALDAFLNAQLEHLALALNTPFQRPLTEEKPPTGEDTTSKRRRSQRNNGGIGADDSLGMEHKLEEERKPIRRILQEDCVQLGLVEPARAKRLCGQMAGKEPREAEAEVVAELRNNLHAQIRAFMRKHKGGPWDSPKLQEDVRMDIAGTRSVSSLITLTRALLREREEWEQNSKKGTLSNILRGKIRLSPQKK